MSPYFLYFYAIQFLKLKKTEKREEFKKLKKGGLKGEIWDYSSVPNKRSAPNKNSAIIIWKSE